MCSKFTRPHRKISVPRLGRQINFFVWGNPEVSFFVFYPQKNPFMGHSENSSLAHESFSILAISPTSEDSPDHGTGATSSSLVMSVDRVGRSTVGWSSGSSKHKQHHHVQEVQQKDDDFQERYVWAFDDQKNKWFSRVSSPTYASAITVLEFLESLWSRISFKP